MCNINESPCQPQVGARCLFVLQGEWNGCSYKTNWFRYFSVFSKVFLYNLRKASKKTFCAHLRWSVEFVCKVLAARALAISLSAPGATTASGTSEELSTTKTSSASDPSTDRTASVDHLARLLLAFPH